MDFSATIPVRTGSEISDTWRLIISLAIALGVHAVLVTIPVSLAPLVSSSVTSKKSPLEIILLSSKDTESSPVLDNGEPSIPFKDSSAKNSAKAGADRPQTTSRSDAETQNKLKPQAETETPSTVRASPMPAAKPRELERRSAEKLESQSTAGTRLMGIPVDSGAKSRSTVFDPGLAKKLARDRNKVRKFKSEDIDYRTATGTFVQQGDRCWDVKQLIPGDTSSESSQWLKIKCPNSSRSKQDVDRLAEKYGIP